MKTTHAVYKQYGMLFAVCFFLMTAMADKGSGQTVPTEIPPQAWSWPMTAEPQTPAKPAKSGLKNGGHWQGMPLGGLGTGGITRDYHGAFVRWTLKAGDIKFFCEPANMFAVRQRVGKAKPVAHPMYPGYPGVRPLKNPPKKKSLASWGWDFSGEGCTYHALFPKAWNEYPATSKEPVAMTCEQFSPVLPNNYRESSYPVSVFVWHLENTSDQPVETSILFSMVNMVGWFDQFGGGKPGRANAGNVNRAVRQVLPESGGTFKGVVFERESSIRAGHALTEGDGQFCILAKESDRCKVTYLASFETNGDGREAWEPFVKNGALSDDETAWVCGPSRQVAGAVCATVTLAPGEKLSVPMALAWDLPIVAFGSGREHWRQYTKYFGREGRHAREIAGEALSNWQDWSRKIDAWHESVISRRRVPDWLYGMLFNEAYLIVDGYTVWTDGTLEHPGEDPFFGIIECPDYPFYCTLDLWVYGSFIFAEYWPELEKNVLRRFSRSILREDSYLRRITSTGEKYISNAAGAAPHDFGQPEEDPPFSCNSYTHRNPNRWKDLNPQFVLELYRDVKMFKDPAFLRECWPAARAAIEYLARFDSDGDGLIENDGTPDQTMDNIPMKGPSLYCGGLWLAALHAAVEMAEMTGDMEFVAVWKPRADSARQAFERLLWNGTLYRLDTEGPYRDATYIDGLFGLWYGQKFGLTNLIPREHMQAHLKEVYNRNFLAFHKGAFGGANIAGATQQVNTEVESIYNPSGCQISEVLSGLNISFALQLADYGMEKESLDVLQSVNDVIYRRYGLWFRTPAAWNVDGTFRAILNLRPLVIWALENDGVPMSGN